MRQFRDLDDADDRLALARVIEEAFVPEFHVLHVLARLEVAHAGPFLAGLALLLLLLPGPGFGLRFEQPIGHHFTSGFLRSHFQARISTAAKSPAFA